MDKQFNKMLENLKNDRNQTARQRLSNKYNATKKAETLTTTTAPTTTVPTTTAPTTTSLWSDPEIQRTIERLTPEERYKYSQIGEELFKNITNKKDPNVTIFEAAAQIQMMLRDGMLPSELTEEEIRTLIAALGPSEVKALYDIEIPETSLKISSLPENERETVSECIHDNTRETKRTKKNNRRIKNPRKTATTRSD